MTLPLESYTVIDLTRARSGPTCVSQLADMGAKVIQVGAREDVEGDFPRHGFDFQNLHRNKRSISLDLKSPTRRRDPEAARRAAPTSSSRTSAPT